jgi:tetratricopeptide (TPR) repeat protein
MSALTSLRLLIRKMSTEEKKVARNFLTAFSIRGAGAPNQALKLFDLLCRETKGESELNDGQIESLIYSRKSGTAFPRLILRLKDKLNESLLLSVNLERPNAYSERGRALHEIRKGISQAQILQSRGIWDSVLIILNECVEKAAKYEHYEEWAAALRVRLEMKTVDKGKITFEIENQQYEKVIRCLLASKKALEYYSQLASEIQFKAASVSLDLLQEQIKELQIDLEQTGSANVAFFLHYLETHYYQETRQFKAASVALRRQAELVEFHPALYSVSRLTGVLINLAWNEIYTRRFASALRYTDRIEKILPDKHFNLFQCYETCFYAYFYTGKYDKALERINTLLKQDSSSTAEYRIGKREYQKACVLFMMGKHDQVHKILLDLNPIENDHEGWNLGLRMLHVINDIELEKTENAFNRIENMRKHIEKLKKANRENPREVLKYEILRTLVNTRFDFMETRKRKKQELDKLSSGDSIYAWRILSPELIIFNQWFESKVFKQELVLKTPAYNEPVLN